MMLWHPIKFGNCPLSFFTFRWQSWDSWMYAAYRNTKTCNRNSGEQIELFYKNQMICPNKNVKSCFGFDCTEQLMQSQVIWTEIVCFQQNSSLNRHHTLSAFPPDSDSEQWETVEHNTSYAQNQRCVPPPPRSLRLSSGRVNRTAHCSF